MLKHKGVKMREQDIIRAWKDKQFRKSLSEEQQALLPDSPVGRIELDENELMGVNGGTQGTTCSWQMLTVGCCNSLYQTPQHCYTCTSNVCG